MEDNQFFKLIWRFNSLIFMIGGILAIVILLFAGYRIIQETMGERSTQNIVNVQQDKSVREQWALGHLAKIPGSPYLMIPLNSDQHYAQSYYNKSASSVRNYLFINGHTNAQHWLFETNRYLISDVDLLSEKPYGAEDREIRAILYKIVKDDSNGDNRLTEQDLQTIGLSLPDGKGYQEILKSIDFFIGHQILDKQRLLILFQRQGVGFSVNVDLTSLTMTQETQLPDMNFK